MQRVIRTVQIMAVMTAFGLIAALFLTSPDELGPFGITLWFAGLLLFLTNVITLLVYRFRKQYTSEGLLLALRRGFLAGSWLTAVLALGSLRQLTFRDIILLTVLVIVVDFYMRRMQP